MKTAFFSTRAVLFLVLVLLAPVAYGQFPDPCDGGDNCAGCGDSVCVGDLESCSSCPADCGACAPSCVEPPSGISAFWTFDHSSTYAYPDQVGSNWARKEGTVTSVAGKVGNAVFLSHGDALRIRNHADVNLSTGDFSVVFWARVPPSVPPYGTPGYVRIDKTDWSGSGRSGWGITVTSRPTFWFPNIAFHDESEIRDDQWHLVAFTVDRDHPSGVKIYVDGVVTDSQNPSNHQGSLDSTTDLMIGGLQGAPGHMRGYVDELQIYKRVLAFSEIREIYLSGSVGLCRPAELPFCPGGTSCSADSDCGFTQIQGLLGTCHSGVCVCK